VAAGAVGLLGLGLVATVARAGAHLVFIGMDWPLVVAQPEDVPVSLASILDGTSATLASLVHRGLLATFGLNDYAAYLIPGAIVHLAACLSLVGILSRNGPTHVAFAAGIVHLLLATRDGMMLSATAFFAILPVAFGLGAIWAWSRPDPSRRLRVAGGVAVFLSVASGPVGLPFALAAAWLLRPQPRFPPGVLPVVVLALWLVLYGDSVQLPDVGEGASRVARLIREQAAAILGLPHGSVMPALLLAALLAALTLAARPPARLARAAAIGIVSCLALGGIRPDPVPHLYVYAGGVLMILLLAQAAGRAWCGVHVRPTRGVLATAVAIWALTVLVGAGPDVAIAHRSRTADAGVLRLEAASLALLPPLENGTIKLESRAFGGITLGEYVDASRRYGGPIASTPEMRSLLAVRLAADRLLFRSLEAQLHPAVSDKAPRDSVELTYLELSDMTPLPTRRSCLLLEVGGTDPFVVIEVPRRMEVSYRFAGEESHQVFYRFFADGFQEEAALRTILPPRMWYRVRPPEVATAGRWTVRLDPPDLSGPMEVCLSPNLVQPQLGTD